MGVGPPGGPGEAAAAVLSTSSAHLLSPGRLRAAAGRVDRREANVEEMATCTLAPLHLSEEQGPPGASSCHGNQLFHRTRGQWDENGLLTPAACPSGSQLRENQRRSPQRTGAVFPVTSRNERPIRI
uniref:Uncharacterized protein n=1 Tax=Myotis myotis TaxID=51298 RepID=A0A7J7VZE5_MYOMY|nr:hypothetical protein mMyoMyo1_012378 [Myotis myotis]